MAKKGMKIGLALAAGAGAAAVLAKTTSKEHKAPAPVSNTRLTGIQSAEI